jgi:hypothetical protein
MPIQNVGTLIENLVVAEAAAVLIDHASGRGLGFVWAFAMPTLSEWRPHGQAVGISDSALAQIAPRRASQNSSPPWAHLSDVFRAKGLTPPYSSRS